MPTQDVETSWTTRKMTKIFMPDGECRRHSKEAPGSPSRLYKSPTSTQLDRPESIRFQETERRPMRAVSRGLSIMSGARRNPGSVLTEVSTWDGPTRVKLVGKGYRSLALICTFIAGVQAQIISISFAQTDLASQIVNAFFFAGLFADIGAAVLSAASARWFEMLTPEEAEHVYAWFYDSSSSISGDAQRTLDPEEVEEEEKNKKEVALIQRTNIAEKGSTMVEDEGNVTGPASSPTSCGWYIAERWLYIALKASPCVAILGLAFLLAGVMVWVWTHQGKIVYILCTILCLLLVFLLPPFAIPHDRRKTLTFAKVRRFSG